MKTFSLSMGLKFAALAFVAAIRLDAQTSVRIALQASDGHWVCAELIGGRAVVANRNGWGPWETFNVRDFNGGPLMSGDGLAFQSADGRYFCAEQGGGSTVVANRLGIGAWEQFTIDRIAGAGAIQDGDYVSIRSVNGYYLCAEGGGGGAVNAVTTGVGSWETFRIWFSTEPERTSSSFVDVNGDGILDEIVKPDTYRFTAYISSWNTYCYDYWSYPVNDYFFPWNYFFDFGWNGDNFGSIWYPDPFWSSYSYYSYCDTYVQPALEFVSEAGNAGYQIYQDTSGGTSYNPSTWQLILSSTGFGDGINTVYLGLMDVNAAYLGQYFLVKLGKQPPAGGFDESQFYSGAMNLTEFADYAMNWFDPGAKDTDVMNEPEVYDALEEPLEDLVRQGKNLPANPKTDTNLLLRRVIVIQIIIEVLDQWPVSYCVYRKFDAANDKAYIGRTAGPGDPWSVVARRDAKPDRAAMNAAGYKRAEVHSWICTYGLSKFGYAAHRGREQIVMDNYNFLHNKKSSFNINRGVKVNHPMRYAYYLTSNALWGSISLFTGDSPGSHWYDVMTIVPPDKLAYGWDTIQPYAGL